MRNMMIYTMLSQGKRDRMSVLTYADLQGTTMRAMSSRELKGTNFGGQFHGFLGDKLGDHEDSSRSTVIYSQFCFKDVWP